MKFIILAVGNKMPEWVEAGFVEYAMRMSQELPVELLKIKPERRSKSKNIEQVLCAEATRILAALPSKCRTVAMDRTFFPGMAFDTVVALDEWAGPKHGE